MRAIDYDELMKFPIRENHCDKIHGDKNFIYGIECVFEYIAEMPIIDVQPVVRAKWNCVNENENVYMCSNCGYEFMLNDGNPKEHDMKYCCCCGANLSEGE